MMRWPIHLQLLVPMVAVVLLASLLATAITACWIAVRVRSEQEEILHRVKATLGEAAYPPTEPVLLQVRGLSGDEFVLISADGKLQETTLPADRSWLAENLLPLVKTRGGGKAVVSLRQRNYLVECVAATGHALPTAPQRFLFYIPKINWRLEYGKPSIRR